MTTQPPTFMRDDVPTKEPELDVNALVIGSPVVVTVPRFRAGSQGQKALAEVTTKARVWVTITEIGPRSVARQWRMRLDTQSEGSRMYPQHDASFRTPEQDLYHEAFTQASLYLSQQGIRLDLDSPWNETLWGTIRLARMIWGAENR